MTSRSPCPLGRRSRRGLRPPFRASRSLGPTQLPPKRHDLQPKLRRISLTASGRRCTSVVLHSQRLHGVYGVRPTVPGVGHRRCTRTAPSDRSRTMHGLWRLRHGVSRARGCNRCAGRIRQPCPTEPKTTSGLRSRDVQRLWLLRRCLSLRELVFGWAGVPRRRVPERPRELRLLWLLRRYLHQAGRSSGAARGRARRGE